MLQVSVILSVADTPADIASSGRQVWIAQAA
jgi:hypothetical protein